MKNILNNLKWYRKWCGGIWKYEKENLTLNFTFEYDYIWSREKGLDTKRHIKLLKVESYEKNYYIDSSFCEMINFYYKKTC